MEGGKLECMYKAQRCPERQSQIISEVDIVKSMTPKSKIQSSNDGALDAFRTLADFNLAAWGDRIDMETPFGDTLPEL